MKLWQTVKQGISRLLSSLTSVRTAGVLSPATDTEFTAEVVRIVEIKAHPNADRLEIATFELAANPGVASSYEVVTGKGELHPGDLAAYFSVDCVLPTDNAAFSFLLKRLDGAGKTHYRLRAARLRGVFSQGLLVPAPAGFEWGASVADHFGVTYYRSPEESDGLPTQPSTRPRSQPFPVYTVDSLKKLPNLFAVGERVQITEKVHGTNFRFGWVRRKILGIPCGWKFVIGSHRVIKERDDDYERGFYKEDVWRDAAALHDLERRTRDYKGYTFYGELYGYTLNGRAIQDLTYGCDPGAGPQLRCFDVRDPHGKWVSAMERPWILTDIGVNQVPHLYTGPWESGIAETLAEGVSLIDPAQMREGCVVEALEGAHRKAKYVGQEYLMRKAA